jgi:uncharacterized protein YjbJ (UPF0337 family)
MGAAMDWDEIRRNWSEYKLNARTRWSRLTTEDLERIAGNREQLAGKIREAYAISEAEAQQQLVAWHAALREDNPFR